MPIPDRLRELREQNALSQEDAASRVGITLRQWQRWETGESEPYKRNLLRLASAFDVHVGYFFDTPDRDGEPSQMDRIEAKVDRLVAQINLVLGDEGLPEPQGELGRRARGSSPTPRIARRTSKKRAAGGA